MAEPMEWEFTDPERRFIQRQVMVFNSNKRKAPERKQRIPKYYIDTSDEENDTNKRKKMSDISLGTIEYATQYHKDAFFTYMMMFPSGGPKFVPVYDDIVCDETLANDPILQEDYIRFLHVFVPNVIPSW